MDIVHWTIRVFLLIFPTQVFYSPRPRLLRVKDNTAHSLQLSKGWALAHPVASLSYTKLLLLSEVRTTTHHGGMWKTTQHILCYSQWEGPGALAHPVVSDCTCLSFHLHATQHGTYVKRHLFTFFRAHHGAHVKRQLYAFFATIHGMSSNHFHTQTGILLNFELLLS